MWLVAEEAEQPLIERQWLAHSERPLALEMLSASALAQSEKCPCDVVVFPAHMLGELIARNWLVELPASLQPIGGGTPRSADAIATGRPGAGGGQASSSGSSLAGGASDEAATVPPPAAAWIDQSRYGRRLWGVSLGVTTPVLMANFALPGALTEVSPTGEADSASPSATAFWQSMIDALARQSQSSPSERADAAGNSAASDTPSNSAGTASTQAKLQNGPQPDAQAVCDRFLMIVTSTYDGEARFGTLIDPETLEPRIDQAPFVAAANILLQLHRGNSSPQAMLGSPAEAWQALSSNLPNVSIGLPPAASAEVDKVTNIEASLPPLAPVRSGTRIPRGWNSGQGLVASLTDECRQTGLAVDFVRWLAGDANRGLLGKRVSGITADGTYAPGSSAWRAQRLAQRLAGQPRLPDQPRLPGSLDYRQTLGEQLVKMLRGEQSPEAALRAAGESWKQITATRDKAALRRSYEESLGL